MKRKEMYPLPEFAQYYMNYLSGLLKEENFIHKIFGSRFYRGYYLIHIYNSGQQKNLMLENYGESTYRHKNDEIVSYDFIEIKDIVLNLNIYANNMEKYEDLITKIVLTFFADEKREFETVLNRSGMIEHVLTRAGLKNQKQ